MPTVASHPDPKTYDTFELTFTAAEPPAGGSNVSARYANRTRLGVFRYGDVAERASALMPALQEGATSEEVINTCGGALFDALFNGPIGDAWIEQRAAAGSSGHGVRLCIMTETPALIGVPWEYLYDRERGLPLALDANVSVVRALPVSGSAPLAVEGDLRVLVLLASPRDLAPIDVEREWANLTAATATAAVSLIRIEPTYEALQGALREHKPHVVHFTGHGGFPPVRPGASDRPSSQQGALAFCGGDGKAAIAPGSDLALLLVGCTSLRLVYLNACAGAVAGTASAFAGVAQQLLQKGAPAVLAMQAPVQEDHARRFSQEFYRAIADGYGVEQAIREGRTRVKEVAAAWGIPTFYYQGVEPFALKPLSSEEKAERLWQKVQTTLAAGQDADSRRRLLKEVLKLNPAHSLALAEQRRLENLDTAAQLYAAGEAYYQQQEWRAAYRNLEEAERLAPNFRQTRALLAEILGKLGSQAARPAFDFSAQVEEYRPILNALQEGRLVPFLGWEVSQFGRPAGDGWVRGHTLPSEAEAARELTQRLQDVQNSDFSLLEASQYTSLIEGETALYERLSALYGGDYHPTILHRFLAELPGRLRAKGYPTNTERRYVIFTLALDDLLEHAFHEIGQPYHLFAFCHRQIDENGVVLPGHFIHVPPGGDAVPVKTPNDYTGHDSDRLPIVVKLSGRRLTPEPDSMLVTEDQYLEYLPAQEIGALLPATLLRQINRRSFLFFGYSLQPWHFRLLWQRMRYQKRQLHDRSWAVIAELNTIEREFWRSHNIVPIIAAPEGVVAYASAWLDRLEAQA